MSIVLALIDKQHKLVEGNVPVAQTIEGGSIVQKLASGWNVTGFLREHGLPELADRSRRLLIASKGGGMIVTQAQTIRRGPSLAPGLGPSQSALPLVCLNAGSLGRDINSIECGVGLLYRKESNVLGQAIDACATSLICIEELA